MFVENYRLDTMIGGQAKSMILYPKHPDNYCWMITKEYGAVPSTMRQECSGARATSHGSLDASLTHLVSILYSYHGSQEMPRYYRWERVWPRVNAGKNNHARPGRHVHLSTRSSFLFWSRTVK
jgi:hypothetical protein